MEESEFVAAPSVTGILHCLKLLAQEAASLRLPRTLSAIEDALDMAASESGVEASGENFTRRRSPVLH